LSINFTIYFNSKENKYFNLMR